jgi:hypothetical protein
VDSLQDGADSSHTSVDVGVSEEIGGEVAVQPGLDGSRCVDPQRGVEQDVVQELPGQERLAERLRLA